MKPSLLIDKQITEVTRVIFTVGERVPVTVFQSGLTGVEQVALQFLINDEDADLVLDDDSAWQSYKMNGTTQVLDANNTVITIPSPGVYALLTDAATAQPIRLGVFGN